MPEPKAKTRGTFLAEVVANERICDEHFRMTLSVPAFSPSRPGQFIQLLCRPPGEQAGPREVVWAEGKPPKFTQPELTRAEPLLRRPLSLAGRRDGKRNAEIDLIYRAIGRGTRWLSSVSPGEQLSVLGPLGNAFSLRQDRPQAAVIGGGVGIPPMLYLAEALAAAGRQVTAFSGASSKTLLPLGLIEGAEVSREAVPTACVREFPPPCKSVVATDDGTLGFKGFVSDAFERWLKAEDPAGPDLVVYCCGPEALMKAVGEICIDRGIECQLALERYMACGMGTCQSCNVKIRDDSPEGWSYKLCCTDGPIFDAREVVW